MKYAPFLAIFILLISLNLLIFNPEFYQEEAQEYKEYKEHITNLLSYFKGAELEKENYSEREILHLKDVRKLIWASIIITILLLGIITLSIKKNTKEQNKKELIRGGIYSIILSILISLTLLSFSASFVTFHELLFTNNLWLLPANAVLIQMFPQEFFIESTKQILLYSFILSLTSIALGIKIPGEKHGKRT